MNDPKWNNEFLKNGHLLNISFTPMLRITQETADLFLDFEQVSFDNGASVTIYTNPGLRGRDGRDMDILGIERYNGAEATPEKEEIKSFEDKVIIVVDNSFHVRGAADMLSRVRGYLQNLNPSKYQIIKLKGEANVFGKLLQLIQQKDRIAAAIMFTDEMTCSWSNPLFFLTYLGLRCEIRCRPGLRGSMPHTINSVDQGKAMPVCKIEDNTHLAFIIATLPLMNRYYKDEVQFPWFLLSLGMSGYTTEVLNIPDRMKEPMMVTNEHMNYILCSEDYLEDKAAVVSSIKDFLRARVPFNGGCCEEYSKTV